MNDFIRGSSSYTRNELHVCFKVKYCHKVFDFVEIKKRCEEIFREVAENLRVIIEEIGFDSDHVHMDIVIRSTQSISGVAKKFKGTSGWKLLREFPLLKKKFFWGSGFWGEQIFADSVGKEHTTIRTYVRNQGANRKSHLLNIFIEDGILLSF